MKNYENSAPAALIGMRGSVVEYRRAVTKLMKGVSIVFLFHCPRQVSCCCALSIVVFAAYQTHAIVFVAPRRLDFNYSPLPTKNSLFFENSKSWDHLTRLLNS